MTPMLSVATLVLILGLLAYAWYLQLATAFSSWQIPTREGNRLVQRDSHGRERRGVDLTAPFQVELLHYDGINASYRVRQGRNRLRFSIPAGSDGRLVAEVLHLPWPPPTTPASQWTP